MPQTLDGEPLILDLLDGFIRSKVLMTAFRLDLFTRLTRESLTLEELLKAHQLPDRSGTILINACTALGLLQVDAGRYSTPKALAPFLRQGADEPRRPTTDLISYYDEVYAALTDMESLVKTDGVSSTFKKRDYFHENVTEVKPDVAADYSAYLDTTVKKIVEVVLKTYPFEKKEYLLDLCGCTGAFCSGILRAVPSLKGAFLDVPACADIGRANLAKEPELQARMEALSGDVVRSPIPKADVITFCRSALDFSDEKLLTIYRRVREALNPGGEFVIIERMIPEQETEDSRTLHMRAVYFLAKSQWTRYRKVSHHIRLLKEAGFQRADTLNPDRPYEFFKEMRIIVAAP